jgi:hypothetical protein
MCRQVFEPENSDLLIDVSNRRIAKIRVGFEKLKKLGQPFAHGLRVGLFVHGDIVPTIESTDKPRQIGKAGQSKRRDVTLVQSSERL